MHNLIKICPVCGGRVTILGKGPIMTCNKCRINFELMKMSLDLETDNPMVYGHVKYEFVIVEGK